MHVKICTVLHVSTYIKATTRYFYALKIYGAILPQSKTDIMLLFHYQAPLDNFFKRNHNRLAKSC